LLHHETVDPSQQYRDKVLFPEKLAKANEMLKTAKLPKKRRSKTNNRTATIKAFLINYFLHYYSLD